MGVITLKIDDQLEEKLRRKAAKTRGAARGVISASVEDALRIWLNEENSAVQEASYVATRGGRRIAEAGSLGALSARLREIEVDPRDVTIESIPPLSIHRRMGLRTTSRTVHE